jgi:3-oxoacyl-[acyl-carrier-protein] synthase-3
MTVNKNLRILGTGSAVPAYVLTNAELEQMVDTSDEWIRTRTGIGERRIAKTETSRELAGVAARAALEAADIDPAEIAVVICATFTQDNPVPALAAWMQRDLGLSNNILAFDLNAACSGFIFALITAQRVLKPGEAALVLGIERLSSVTDYTDRKTCVLFGDGAGAVVVRRAGAEFSYATFVEGSDETLRVVDNIFMDGQAVFRFAIEKLTGSIEKVSAEAGVTLDEVDVFICHQANMRIITSAAARLGVPVERFFVNLEQYGNTSAASVPMALDEAVRTGFVKRGDKIILSGFGGGLSAGTVLMEY